MRYLLKYLQRSGLMPSLLIVGVLGGLMAPLPSEAGTPTITLKVDNGSPVSILVTSPATCTATEGTGTGGQGYTACYSILTGSTVYSGTNAAGSTRGYTIQPISSGSARLKVADTAGQDKFSLVGVKFVPVADATTGWATGTDAAGLLPNSAEEHNLTIVYSHTFDDPTANAVGNAGIYKWNVRTSGQFFTGPTGGSVSAKKCTTSDWKCDALNNRVDFTGKGTFSSILSNVDILSPDNSGRDPASTQNRNPLNFTTTGTHLTSTARLSWDGASNTTMGQVDPYYPEFNCTNAANGTDTSGYYCRPTITLTLKAKLFGPDTFQVINGGDGWCAKCTERLTAQQDKLIKFIKGALKILNFIAASHPNWLQLRAFIDQVTVYLAGINAVPFSADGQPCPGAKVLGLTNIGDQIGDVLYLSQDPLNSPGIPAPPETTGTITINKHLLDACTTDNTCTPLEFHFEIVSVSFEPPAILFGVTTQPYGGISSTTTVPAGTYNVAERLFLTPGWSLTTAVCNSGGAIDGVVVESGSNVTCDFYNSPVATTGTIVIIKTANEFGTNINDTFGFTGTGAGIDANFSITTDETSNTCEGLCGTGRKTFSGLTTGEAGGPRTIKETSFPSHVPDNYWLLYSLSCERAIEEDDGEDTQFTTDSYYTQTLTVTKLRAGDTLTCTFNNRVHSP